MDQKTDERDPRGWLKLAPELETFAYDATFGAAIASGDARRLQEALEARRKRPRSPGEVNTIDRLLARRRLFLMPTEAPSLYTLNGIGQRIYGQSDAAPDGSYVGTLFYTFVYLPIWPVAQYLLVSQGKTYTFFGEVPLSGAMRTWRKVFGAAALALLLIAAGSTWTSSQNVNAHLLNHLDVPVTVEVAGARLPLAPNQRLPHRLPVGRQTIRTTAEGGRLVEELQVDVPRWNDLVVYNVLGAAPLFLEPVVYSSKAAGQQESPPPTFLGGRSFVTQGTVSYLFQPPPKTIKMSGSGSTTRWRVDLASGGWHTTVRYLHNQGQGALAAELARRLALAEPGNDDAFRQAIWLGQVVGGLDGSLAVARAVAEAHPGFLDAQRLFGSLLLTAGRRDEALRLARERLGREPDSPEASYLHVRLLSGSEGLTATEQAAARFPQYAQLQRLVGWARLNAGQYATALAAFDGADKLAPAAESDPEPQVYALVALGRTDEALDRLAAVLDKQPTVATAAMYAQVAGLPGVTNRKPMRYLEPMMADEGGPLVRAYAAALAGAKPPSPKELESLAGPEMEAPGRILAAFAVDPAQALAAVRQDPARTSLGVPRDVLLLLAGEAQVVREPALARRLLEHAGALGVPIGEILAFLAGERDSIDDGNFTPGERAALHLARARAAARAGRPSAGDYAAARRLDILHGPVATALARWPKP